MKVVINTCFGGFGISDAAYEKLIEWGVPVQKYEKEERDAETQLYKKQPLNDGEVIFDRDLTPPGSDSFGDIYWKFKGSGTQQRYWDTWLHDNRSHPLLIRVVEALGEAANNHYSDLKIIEVPDGVKYEISEYDGREHIAEEHRTWS